MLDIIQISGVFLASLFGFINVALLVTRNNVPGTNAILMAAGIAMMTCGIFLK